MTAAASTLEDVKTIIVETLGIEDRRDTLDASTALFGSIPELDSFAVVSLAVALESHFGFEIDDGDFSADVFETVGTLVDFVERNRR